MQTFELGNFGIQNRGESDSSEQSVQVIDFPTWLATNFKAEDIVVIKMDVEGAEFDILAKMLQTDLVSLIDLLLLECHPAKGECGPLRKQLKAKAVPFLEESQQVSKNTYQPTKQWGPTVAAFREDLQSPQCAFLNVTLS